MDDVKWYQRRPTRDPMKVRFKLPLLIFWLSHHYKFTHTDFFICDHAYSIANPGTDYESNLKDLYICSRVSYGAPKIIFWPIWIVIYSCIILLLGSAWVGDLWRYEGAAGIY